MDSIKKRKELTQFKKFLNLVNLSYANLHESESPDFIFSLDSRRIGVELTELKHPKYREIVGIQRNIIKKAKISCHKLEPVQVKVTFSHPVSYRNGKKDEITKYIERVVKKSIVLAKKMNGSVYSVPLSDKAKTYGIYGIYINDGICNGVRWLEHHRWSCIECGWVSVNFQDLLQQCIESKESKIKNYLSQCDECWLLIVSDCSKKDQMFTFQEPLNVQGHSSFKHIYFLELSGSNLCEVAVAT